MPITLQTFFGADAVGHLSGRELKGDNQPYFKHMPAWMARCIPLKRRAADDGATERTREAIIRHGSATTSNTIDTASHDGVDAKLHWRDLSEDTRIALATAGEVQALVLYLINTEDPAGTEMVRWLDTLPADERDPSLHDARNHPHRLFADWLAVHPRVTEQLARLAIDGMSTVGPWQGPPPTAQELTGWLPAPYDVAKAVHATIADILKHSAYAPHAHATPYQWSRWLANAVSGSADVRDRMRQAVEREFGLQQPVTTAATNGAASRNAPVSIPPELSDALEQFPTVRAFLQAIAVSDDPVLKPMLERLVSSHVGLLVGVLEGSGDRTATVVAGCMVRTRAFRDLVGTMATETAARIRNADPAQDLGQRMKDEDAAVSLPYVPTGDERLQRLEQFVAAQFEASSWVGSDAANKDAWVKEIAQAMDPSFERPFRKALLARFA